MKYAFRVGDIPPEGLRTLAFELGSVAQDAYMTAAQRLTAESYARGFAEGKAEGKTEGKAELLLRLLSLRFGALPEAMREKILHAPPERMDDWAERVFTAASVEELLS